MLAVTGVVYIIRVTDHDGVVTLGVETLHAGPAAVGIGLMAPQGVHEVEVVHGLIGLIGLRVVRGYAQQ